MKGPLVLKRGLLAERIQGYDEEQLAVKQAFHRDGKAFLRSLAKSLGLREGQYDLRSNLAGPAVSGEVTLHADHLYVQLQESCLRPGVGILYRSCRSRRDYLGGHNHWEQVRNLRDEEAQERFISHCRYLLKEGEPVAQAA